MSEHLLGSVQSDSVTCTCGWQTLTHDTWEAVGADFDSHLEDNEVEDEYEDMENTFHLLIKAEITTPESAETVARMAHSLLNELGAPYGAIIDSVRVLQ